jgi:uncharacterized protein involved in exopolysaccharide biosynthesis
MHASRRCVILLSLCTLNVSGACSWMPTSGPASEDVRVGQRDPKSLPYARVDVTPEVVNVLASYGTPRLAGAFLDRRLPHEIRFGVGDVVSVTIFEAMAGGLFIPVEAGVRPGNFITLPNQNVDTRGNISVPYAGAIRAAGLIGAIYVVITPPSYTAQATMIIDTRKVQLFQQQSLISDVPIDAGAVDSQVEILRSENVILPVIKDLRLTEDPEFVEPRGLVNTLFQFGMGVFNPSGPSSEFELMRRALREFERRLNVKRVRLTYVIEINFRSFSAERAAEIANAIADAYVVDQLEAKYQATRRAGLWLQDRIAELRGQSAAAERAVVEFKTQNNIVDTGGRLMTEQQLAELNSQLVLAGGQRAEAKARLDRIAEIVQTDVPDATVTDTLRNEVITKLRSQYLDLMNREADISGRYSRDHQAAVNLRNQRREIRRAIVDELRRIAETY